MSGALFFECEKDGCAYLVIPGYWMACPECCDAGREPACTPGVRLTEQQASDRRAYERELAVLRVKYNQ